MSEDSHESADASTSRVYITTNGNDVLAIEIDDGHLIFGVFDRSMAVSITLDRIKVREVRDSLSVWLGSSAGTPPHHLASTYELLDGDRLERIRSDLRRSDDERHYAALELDRRRKVRGTRESGDAAADE